MKGREYMNRKQSQTTSQHPSPKTIAAGHPAAADAHKRSGRRTSRRRAAASVPLAFAALLALVVSSAAAATATEGALTQKKRLL